MQTLTRLTAPYRATQTSRESRSVNTGCRRRVRGFTLIESLVSISIIVLLGGMAFPHFSRIRELKAREAVRSDLKQLYIWFEIAKQDTGSYPVSLDAFPALGSFVREGGHVKDTTYNYCFRVLVSTSDHFVIEARPCDGGGDGTVVYCIDETYDIVDCGTDEGAVQDQQARELTVKLLAFKSIHHVIASSDEVDLAREIKSFLALEETQDFAFDVMDGNLDGEIAQEELLAFGQPREDDPLSIATARQFLRESSSILRLDVGQYDGVHRAHLQVEPADLLSRRTLADFIQANASKPGVAHALNQKLVTAELAEARDDFELGAGAIRAFKNQLRAQQGKSLTFEDADVSHTMVDVIFPTLVFGE